MYVDVVGALDPTSPLEPELLSGSVRSSQAATTRRRARSSPTRRSRASRSPARRPRSRRRRRRVLRRGSAAASTSGPRTASTSEHGVELLCREVLPRLRVSVMFDYRERRRRLGERMEAEGVDVLFLAPSADLEYLTGVERQIPNFGEASYAHGWVAGAFFRPGARSGLRAAADVRRVRPARGPRRRGRSSSTRPTTARRCSSGSRAGSARRDGRRRRPRVGGDDAQSRARSSGSTACAPARRSSTSSGASRRPRSSRRWSVRSRPSSRRWRRSRRSSSRV